MADSDKNILIKPNIASTDSAPTIEFVGADSNVAGRTVTLNVISDNEGTLSFLNDSNNQIFSINNDEDGIIFSVNKFNDSSTPMIEVSADSGVTGGLIKLAEFGGQVIIGGDSAQVGGAIPDSSDFLVVHKNIRLLNSGQFIGSGTGLTGLQASALSGTLPALNASNLTSVPAANLTGTLPAINGSNLTNISASTLSGYSWTQFLRSDTSDNFTSGTLEFQDNTMLAFGASSDTIIEHDTGYNPDVTRFYANSSVGGMLFQDGTTNIFDIAYTYANQAVFHNTTRFLDNIYFYFGTNTDTWIRHNTSLSPQRTEFVASTSNGGMEFRDGNTACFDVGVTNANSTTFISAARVQDDVAVYFGTGADTFIKHNSTLGYMQFMANTSDGGMGFQDGNTLCFDVAATTANTSTFHTDTEFRDSAVVCLDIGKTAPNTTTLQRNVDLGQNTRVKAYRRFINNNSAVDLAGENFFKISTVSTNPISFSNQSQGQAGIIHLDNAAGRVVSFGTEVAINADVLTSLSTAGQYMLTYFCTADSGNDTVLVGATGALT